MLRKLVWDQLEPHLDGIHSVIIIPDHTLHRLPWSALPGRKPNEYLLHDYSLTTVSSGQHLYAVLVDPPIQSPPNLLLAGGIRYDQRPTKLSASDGAAESADRIASPGQVRKDPQPDFQWGYLPGTEKEVKTLAELWGRGDQLRRLDGTAADERSLSQSLPKSRFAHLATHGFFDQQGEVYGTDMRQQSLFQSQTIRQDGASVASRNPLLMTGIVMAGANLLPDKDELDWPISDDGILTAEEIAGLDLRQTELVTLSACQTGLGDVVAGQGVFGLRRTFHQSGVRSVLASLWKVDDTATLELMTQFYRNLWVKKMSKVDALRHAQLWMLENYQQRTSRSVTGRSRSWRDSQA